MKAVGVTSVLSFTGSIVAGGEDAENEDENPTDDARPPTIHSQYGYAGTSANDVPKRLASDEPVGLHVDEQRIDAPSPPDFDLTVEFGAFHFDPVGLQVKQGAIVKFDFHTPEHTATAFHPDQERQQRVPDGVPAITSPVNEHHGFWLYRFEEEGVYDLFCAPHEYGGMGMRIVVGDSPSQIVRARGRPPLPLTGALLGSGLPPDDPDIGHPKLDPQHIIDHGPIFVGEDPAEEDVLDLDLYVTITGPNPS